MKDFIVNYHSLRSEKARISTAFNRIFLFFLNLLAIIMLSAGVFAIFAGLSLGWVFIGFSVVPIMSKEWYRSDLYRLPALKSVQSIDDVLDADVLGRLPEKYNAMDLVNIVGSVDGGHFFAVRFGISPKFLQDLVLSNDIDVQNVWKKSYELYKQTNSETISSVILLTAIIDCVPNKDSMLGHLQLELKDLIEGVKWFNHLNDMVEQLKRPVFTGGFARDWSFGWTPLLNRFGQNISRQADINDITMRKLVAHEEALDSMISIFCNDGRQNAALVGLNGVGKTQIINTLAFRLLDASSNLPETVRFRQIYMMDAASLIAAAPDRGDLEQLIPRIFNEAYRAKNIIICLDNAQLFFQDGIGSVDITNVLLPIIEAGDLRIIMIIDEQNFLQISKRNPAIANILNRISIDSADYLETISIMQDRSMVMEFQNHVTYMYQSITEAYRLGDRYIYDLAMPGKALQLLESAAHYSENGLVTARSVQQAIEKTLNIKISVATVADDREKLLNMENLIHERMVDQVRAVRVVSDAIRRARVGVRSQSRPIGTFMFLGPTGVGKTELAKALAEVYFDGEDHMVRLDMNEYTSADDASRLIADGVDNSNSLTARIMKQPFSVVLLDEIEKAHPNVLSTLLQMLDEGILRDVKNREVSFRDAIIIATSNAGADRIREYIDRGYDIERFETKIVDELISTKQFHPEFLNRFDEIVIFRPLHKKELLQVIDLILAGVNKTLSLQKISMEVSEDAKKYLVDVGYDPKLGARPMRRIVQRAIENTVANQVLLGRAEPGSKIYIDLDQVKSILDSKNNADAIVDSNKLI